MSDAPALRLTVSAVYRHGAEVLLADAGPLPDLPAVREALNEIDGALDTHADLLFERGAELIIRVAERRFQRHYEPPSRRQKRVAPPGEF
jgi:hypothetical protein